MQFTVRLSIDVAERSTRPPTVLVLSEDRDWRTVVRRVLEEEGYEVLDARHAGQAVVACMRHEGSVDLLLSDGGHGRRRVDFPPRIFKDNPHAKVLHLEARPSSREQLVASIGRTLSGSPARA